MGTERHIPAEIVAVCSLLLLAGCSEKRDWCKSQKRQSETLAQCMTLQNCLIHPIDLDADRYYHEVCKDE